jgi:hypothetical protein
MYIQVWRPYLHCQKVSATKPTVAAMDILAVVTWAGKTVERAVYNCHYAYQGGKVSTTTSFVACIFASAY